MVLVVMIDSIATCADIDARAKGESCLVSKNLEKKPLAFFFGGPRKALNGC